MAGPELRELPKEPLSAAEERLLRQLFRKRLRSFFALGAMFIILTAIELGPNTQKIHAAIDNPKLRWTISGIALAMAGALFYRKVWIYRRDLKAGFKYVNRMLVIRKNEPGADGMPSIDLEDLSYHKLRVGAEAWNKLKPGDRYPLCFAAHSGFPLTKAMQEQP